MKNIYIEEKLLKLIKIHKIIKLKKLNYTK